MLPVCEPIQVGRAAAIGAGWLPKTRVFVPVPGVWRRDRVPGGFGMTRRAVQWLIAEGSGSKMKQKAETC